MDRIYDHIDFRSEAFGKYLSQASGDGGLEPGKLTLEEELERFSGQSFASDILPRLTLGHEPQKENIGGPCVVALINAAQLGHDESTVRFYGCRGDDGVGESLQQMLERTNLDLSHYRVQASRETASTVVLSDPHYADGHGERTFVNTIGASWHYLPEDIDESFYDAEICLFGGTALVPRIHQGLSSMLQRAKSRGCITVVGTVYDFLNEKEHPGQRWPMGDGDVSYASIDLLIVDHEEALRLSGCPDVPSAIDFFREKGTGAVIVTCGASHVTLWADSPLFGKVVVQTMPVSQAVGMALKQGRKGDSTGCGDNFAGGVIASLAMQKALAAPPVGGGRVGAFDLREACRWGIVSGGFACFYYGGTYLEQRAGEKRALLQQLYDQYREQESASRE